MDNESLKTFNILKYGHTNPDTVREVIDTYWFDRWEGFYKSDWEVADIEGTSESKYCETHYYKFWVYYDDKHNETLVAFVPEFITDFPTSKWLQVGMIIISINMTGKSLDDVYELFKEQYEELHKISMTEEYRRNYS